MAHCQCVAQLLSLLADEQDGCSTFDHLLKLHIDLVAAIVAVVLVLNLLKCLLTVLSIYAIKVTPLLTTGDSSASFLQQKNEMTQGLCLLGKSDLTEWKLKDP